MMLVAKYLGWDVSELEPVSEAPFPLLVGNSLFGEVVCLWYYKIRMGGRKRPIYSVLVKYAA